jgi:hypothetical protein
MTDDGLDDLYGALPASPPVTYSPRVLVEFFEPLSLRQVARKLNLDPAMLCRPLSSRQADRYATLLGVHPVEVWGNDWLRPGQSLPHAEWAEERAAMTPEQRLQFAADALEWLDDARFEPIPDDVDNEFGEFPYE